MPLDTAPQVLLTITHLDYTSYPRLPTSHAPKGLDILVNLGRRVPDQAVLPAESVILTLGTLRFQYENEVSTLDVMKLSLVLSERSHALAGSVGCTEYIKSLWTGFVACQLPQVAGGL